MDERDRTYRRGYSDGAALDADDSDAYDDPWAYRAGYAAGAATTVECDDDCPSRTRCERCGADELYYDEGCRIVCAACEA